MSGLQSLVGNLLYYCSRTGDWAPELTDRPVWKLLDALSDHPDYRSFFDGETAYDILAQVLSEPDLQAHASFSNSEIEQVLSAVGEGLSLMAANHWIVVPLRGGQLAEDIRLRGFRFISGSRAEKTDVLRRLSGISRSQAESRAQHIESGRSPGFFDNPLLAIKTVQQTNYVRRVARYWAFYAIRCLQAIYWGYVYPDDRFPEALPIVRRGCRHLAIHARDTWRYGALPLRFSAECRFSLDWLRRPAHRSRFKQLFGSVVAARLDDDLTYRFSRGLKMFGKAIDAEENQEAFGGMGITLMYLMIAAEAVLLSRHGEKRSRLTVLLPRLAKVPGHQPAERAIAVDQGYRWRSDFVHTGTDKYSDLEDDFSPGPATQSVTLLKRMVGRLLSDASKHIDEMRRQSDADGSSPESRWFDSLERIWERALGLS